MRHSISRAACAVALLALSTSSFAADEPKLTGEPDCRVVNITPFTDLTSTWSGACKDGFANGTGKLEWQRPSGRVMTYEGGMKDGLMHGAGFLDRADHEQYEGDFAGGWLEGKGARASFQGYYEGDFKAGRPHGFGKMTYALGGEYEGEWLNGAPHGKGTARYQGGRTFTGEWAHGKRAGHALAPAARHYQMSSRSGKTTVTGQVPFDKGYAELNAAEKEAVRASYFLDEDDEPVYPVDGTKALTREVAGAAARYAAGKQGDFVMFVDVDATGVATKVSVYSTPAPAMSNYVAFHAMKQKYKPALCAGQPCAGKFMIRGAIK